MTAHFSTSVSTFHNSPFHYHHVNLLWLVLTNHDELTWLSQISYYCTDHSQLNEAWSFINWGWLLSCFVEWDPPSITQCILESRKLDLLFKNKSEWVLCFWGYLYLITGISSVLGTRHCVVTTESTVQDSFISPNSSTLTYNCLFLHNQITIKKRIYRAHFAITVKTPIFKSNLSRTSPKI
jgi:hypothetical protein